VGARVSDDLRKLRAHLSDDLRVSEETLAERDLRVKERRQVGGERRREARGHHGIL